MAIFEYYMAHLNDSNLVIGIQISNLERII